MRLQALYRQVRADTVLTVSICCGLTTALTGIVGYVLAPVVVGSQPSLTEAAVGAVLDPMEFSLWYHLAVLTVAPFVVAMAGAVVLDRQGVVGRRAAVILVAGTVGGPLGTVGGGYLLTAMGVGLGIAPRPSALTVEALVSLVGGFVLITYFALLFGLVFALLAVGAVFITELPAAVAGVLCGRLISRTHRSAQPDPEHSQPDRDRREAREEHSE